MSLSSKFFINRDLKRNISLILRLLKINYALILLINVYSITLMLTKTLNVFWRYFEKRIKLTSNKVFAKKSS